MTFDANPCPQLMGVHRTRQLRPTRQHGQQLVDDARPHRRPERPLDAVPEDHPMRKTFSAPPLTPETTEAANTIAWRRADIGASNGHGNARSLARALSPISLDGKGVQLLSPDTIDLISQEQANGIDQVLA